MTAGPNWWAGCAATTLPIAPGTPLGGYMARTSGATGTLDPLQIGVLHLETQGRSLTLVTVDAIGVDAGLRDRIAATAGLDPATVLLCASHTHSGPQGIVPRLHPIEPDAGDETLRAQVIGRAAGCIAQASAALEPVTPGLVTVDASGAWTNRNAADGANDSRLRLFATRRGDGSVQAIVALSACHPTVLGAESSAVSADLSGGIRRAIAALPGASRATILSLTGAAGDISTRFVRRAATPAEIDRLAKIATRHVPQALDGFTPIDADAASLRHARASVALPSFREHLAADPEAEVAATSAALEAIGPAANPAALRQAITRHQGAILRARMAASEASTTPPVEVAAWLLDASTALVALPVELFTSLGARIERESPFRETLVVGYANGYAGYVADAAAWDAGTYEALASPFARRAGEVLVAAVGDLLRSLQDAGAGASGR
ncbi:MAG TPA: hypothetical protein VNP95_04625 [Thermomicrobiales bacterium]|nr:hypothetical protein [Thermomicrobiales bacterium]